ncbi:MAG: SDR family oxidoreductase [Bacteroidia bacterium]|nr:SDR family oxidoreductase [Bacteroidia bacterium]
MKNLALITGASKGIGKAIAFEMGKRGCNLILTSRSKDLLDELAKKLKQDFGVEVHTFVADLSDESAPNRLLAYCMTNNLPVNILVNNAGYGLWGKFDELTMELQLNMLRLNNENLVHITHLFIPLLKKNKPSYILNVSSTSSYQALPTMAVYAASKIFVLNFSRALRYEMKGDGISVSCLVPGTTSTEFMDRAGQHALKKRAEKVAMTPEEVAAIAVKQMFNRKAEIIPGFINWVSAKLIPHLPKSLVERIAASVYKVK